eukprot:CAMPEP_0114562448 /NCGR_PEP_ID=MMETSP0114-20121206/12537_1 /TAXON_ID=31324 /ORGANISM="Goniomonas sp, Strain m" /LENGTH=137 /DNA_ID=CAMNT_0001748139 /DNA_START=24 /DNA_END=433 /DNA_ORIENTATION=-
MIGCLGLFLGSNTEGGGEERERCLVLARATRTEDGHARMQMARGQDTARTNADGKRTVPSAVLGSSWLEHRGEGEATTGRVALTHQALDDLALSANRSNRTTIDDRQTDQHHNIFLNNDKGAIIQHVGQSESPRPTS